MGKKAMVWGALANNLPDIDVITSLWMTQADGLMAHRGFTHSILFAIVVTPLLSYYCFRRYKQNNHTLNDWLWLIGSGLFIHIVIDAFTSYGTGWYEPFSHERVTFNLIFVADLLYTLPFIIGAVVLMILRKNHPRRVFWQRFALLVNSFYLVFALRNKLETDAAAKSAFENQHVQVERYFTTPTPLNNFLWYVVGAVDSGYFIGYRSILDTFPMEQLVFFPANDSLATEFKGRDEVTKLLRFADGFATFSKADSQVVLNDLRFGQVGGWSHADAPFVFRYVLTENADNDLVIQKGRMEAFSAASIQSLWNRMLGRK